MLFISVFIGVCFLGYLAQTTGLCMVRGVNQWKAGHKEFLLAILGSGVLAWAASLYSYFTDIAVNFRVYAFSGWFVFGGFIFGLGAALNKGCGVSTLGRLTRGDSRMFMTMLGWFIGWIMLSNWSPNVELLTNPLSVKINYGLLIVATIAISIWAFWGDKKRQQLWFSLMGIGLLSGFIYLYQPMWPPSALLHQLSSSLINDNVNNFPVLEQYLLFIALLLGMFLAAWRTNKFLFVRSSIKHWLENIFAGTLMGIGASLAMGGNSVHLLMGLPAFSPASMSAIGGILFGIWSGLYVRNKFQVFN